MTVSRNTLVSSLLGSHETVELFERLGLLHSCVVDPLLMVPYVSIFPLEIRTPDFSNCNHHERSRNSQQQSLFFVTDWHPTVLATTTVGAENHGAVMYIGPDSLALVAHWPLILSQTLQNQEEKSTLSSSSNASGCSLRILDFGCGSGIQALSMISILGACGIRAKATCVDINKRALQFTRFNAMINDLDDNVETLEGDVVTWDEAMNSSGQNQNRSSNILLSLNHVVEAAPYDIVLANPPFVPVPQSEVECGAKEYESQEQDVPVRDSSDIFSKRYGLFSGGGASGEAVLRSILRLTPSLLSDSLGATVGIVSEFMNPDSTLPRKVQNWWRSSVARSTDQRRNNRVGHERNDASSSTCIPSVGIVFTNQYPVSAHVYASRRAGNDKQEMERWEKHLENEGIFSISPGLLFIFRCTNQPRHDECISMSRNQRNSPSLRLHHFMVPKSSLGSVWTPHNYEAVKFAIQKIKETLTSS